MLRPLPSMSFFALKRGPLGTVIDLRSDNTIFEKIRQDGKKLGLCHGVFDLLHPGHITHFEFARRYADVLIVSVTKDEFVKKGPSRPYFALEERIRFLKNIKLIDFVVVSPEETAVSIIETVRPDFYFKGSEYKDSSKDYTGNISIEEQAVSRCGGRIVFTDGFNSSSSALINKALSDFPSNTQKWLDEFRKKFTANQIYSSLDKISELKVTLIGETILDKYTEVDALSKTSKHPILAFHIRKTEIFGGGILAIQDNISTWVKSVDVITSQASDGLTSFLEAAPKNTFFHHVTNPSPAITKHRYIDRGTNQKLFETYDFDPNYFQQNHDFGLSLTSTVSSADVVLIADYGHGMLTESMIPVITRDAKYLCVNVQANAGNRGFNTVEKYPQVNFFTANSGELQIQSRSMYPDYYKLMGELISKKGADYALMTDGERGLSVFHNGTHCNAPALASKVVDKVGAGDSVFAISSLLARVDTHIEIIAFLSNLVAANEVLFRGHSKHVKLSELKKQVKAILA